MLIVNVQGGNIEKALKSYKYKVNKTKQTKQLRDNREYTKPSATKRRKAQKAKYIQQKNDAANSID